MTLLPAGVVGFDFGASTTLGREVSFSGVTFPQGATVETALRIGNIKGGVEVGIYAFREGFLAVVADLSRVDATPVLSSPGEKADPGKLHVQLITLGLKGRLRQFYGWGIIVLSDIAFAAVTFFEMKRLFVTEAEQQPVVNLLMYTMDAALALLLELLAVVMSWRLIDLFKKQGRWTVERDQELSQEVGEDTTAPALVGVPANTTADCGAIPPVPTGTATDNCDPTLTVDFSEAHNVVEGCGTITRTWTVTDNCGNSTAQTQTITVEDNTPPTLTGVPADATADCGAIPPVPTVTATDNCDPTLTVDFAEVNNVVEGCGTITRTWTVTDNCGNSTAETQTITVEDTTAPVLVGVPANTTADCGNIPAPATVTATDNCDPTLTVSFNEANNVVEGCGTITRTWTVTDNCGNTGRSEKTAAGTKLFDAAYQR